MKIITGILYITFIALLLGVASLFLATMLPIPGNIEVKIVKSGSMEPTILTGSVVIVKPQASYRVGDIITFGEDTARQIPTTHRIIESAGDFSSITFTTKGDANEEQDPSPVGERDVIGKVIFAISYMGYVLDFARQPIGFTLMIGIPAGIIILDEIVRIFREVRGMRSAPAKRRDEDEDQDRGRGNFPMSYHDFLERSESKPRSTIRSIDGIRPRMT